MKSYDLYFSFVSRNIFKSTSSSNIRVSADASSLKFLIFVTDNARIPNEQKIYKKRVVKNILLIYVGNFFNHSFIEYKLLKYRNKLKKYQWTNF